MKKFIFLIGITLLAQGAFTQGLFSWGVKGGVNSTKISFDDFSIEEAPSLQINPDYYDDLATFLQTNPTEEQMASFIADHPEAFEIKAPKIAFKPSSYEMGYHFGVFARVKVLAVFIQPELIFSHAEAAIDFSDSENLTENLSSSTATIKYNNFDIPVMIGMKLGPARFNLGPVASFKLDPKIENASKQVKEGLNSFTEATNLATFGGQVGVGVDILKKLTLDIRYEFPLSKLGDQITIGKNTFKTDQRQTQVIGSIGWIF